MRSYEREAMSSKNDSWSHKGKNGRKAQRNAARQKLHLQDVRTYCGYKRGYCFEESCKDCPYAP